MLFLGLFVIITLPMALGGLVAFHGLERTRRCPFCGEDTLRLHSPTRLVLSRLLRSSELHLRWCITCGWRGTARLRTPPRPVRRPRLRPAPHDPLTADRVDIRRLEIDGLPWKVMVQCWAEDGRWIGQLLFIGPDGRACVEDQARIEGGSAIDVLSSALSIPDRTLAGRIRRAIH